MNNKSFIERAKESGDILPTLFNFGEMWRINATRCGGRFNLLFFWMYPIAAVFFLPFTALCLIEMLLAQRNKDQIGRPKEGV